LFGYNYIKAIFCPVCYSFFKKKITYFLKKSSLLPVLHPLLQILKKSKSKNNLKTTLNEKLLGSSQKIVFFKGERKYGSKD